MFIPLTSASVRADKAVRAPMTYAAPGPLRLHERLYDCRDFLDRDHARTLHCNASESLNAAKRVEQSAE
jgi:hypothetical protein